MTKKPQSPKAPVARDDKETVADPCPVKMLMEIFNRLILVGDRAEEDAKSNILMRTVEQAVYDRRSAIEDYVPSLRARSAEGAIFQLALIKDKLEDLEDARENEVSFANHTRAIVQMLYSIKGVVEDITGINGDKLAVEYFMSNALDPQRKINDLLAEVDFSG